MAQNEEQNRLGEAIKELMRQRKRVTLRLLERRAGVSRSEISNIIRGLRKHPNHDALRAIAKALKVDPRYLIFLSSGLTFHDIDEIRARYELPRLYPEMGESLNLAAAEQPSVHEEPASYSNRVSELSPEGKVLLDYLLRADEVKRKINRQAKPHKR